jgi:hypothetical protein
LACNIDSNGGTTTRNDNGIEESYGSNSIPSGFVSRSLDVCDPISFIFLLCVAKYSLLTSIIG